MSKKSTKALASAALMSLVLTTALSASPVKAASATISRTSGADRYATAAQVAKSNWTTTDNVVLVSGEGYADSVSASALAKKLDAPILLTTSDTLSSDAESAIEQLKPKNIYVIGGTASISQSIRDNLKSSYNLVELGGSNRYETNIAVAKELVTLGVSPSDVLVVGGEGFSDALSVAPVAAAKGEILLLANNNEDSIQSVIDFIKDNSSTVTVVGTKNVINDAIYNALGGSTRVDGGSDRFATNLNVLSAFQDSLKNDKLYVANASPATPDNLYADALVASALAGKYTAPLVLVDGDNSTATDDAENYISGVYKSNASVNVNVIGGTGVISDDIYSEISKAIGITPVGPTNPTVNSVSAVDLNQIKVVFNQEVDEDTAEDVTNYKIDGSTLNDNGTIDNTATANDDSAVATLQDDNKTVLITLAKARKQSDDVDVTVKKGVLSADKSDTIPEFTQNVTFSDTTAPTITSVQARGNNKLTVQFSEPINFASTNVSQIASKFKINDKNISGFGLDTSSKNSSGDLLSKIDDYVCDDSGHVWSDKVEFYFTEELPPGNNTLKVSDGDSLTDGGKLCDSAGFPFQEATQDFNVDTLSSTPEVSSITANDDGKVYINFDRPMDAKTATNRSYFAINGDDNTIPSGAVIELKNNDTQVKISGVSGLLNKNSNTIYIKDNVKDAYGNYIPNDTRLSFDLTEDTTKPSVSSVEALDDDTIRVRFNKDVDVNYAANVSNYKIQDNDGTDITNDSECGVDDITVPGGSTTTANVFDINMKDKLVDSQYTITIKNIQDTASTPNVMDDYSTTFDGSGDVNAKVTGVYAVTGDNCRKITLVFNKEMDSSTLNDTDNYQYLNKSGDTKTLPSSSEITPSSDNKSVTIELPDSYTYYDTAGNYNSSIDSEDNQLTKLYATGVKDSNGNTLEVGSYGDVITPAGTGATMKANSLKVYYEDSNDATSDLKADVSFTLPIDSDTLNNGQDFRLNGIKPDSATTDGSKITLIFNNNDTDKSDPDTNVNKIKAVGENAQLTIVGNNNDGDIAVQDVTGATIPTTLSTVTDHQAALTPYYYNAAPKTIVSKTDGYATNWTAVASATAPEVDAQFDTPIEPSSVKPSDFTFAIGGTTLTPTATSIKNGNTVVFTFDPTDSVGSKTVNDYFKNGSTITLTPKSTNKISTLKDKNDSYAYYTASDDDNKGIKIVISGSTTPTAPTATVESVTAAPAPGSTIVVASLQSGLDPTKYTVTVNGTELTYNATAGKFAGVVAKSYSTVSAAQADIAVTEKQASTLPTATVESVSQAPAPGSTIVVATLPSGVDPTQYTITVDGTELPYNATAGKFAGVVAKTYSTVADAQADVQVAAK